MPPKVFRFLTSERIPLSFEAGGPGVDMMLLIVIVRGMRHKACNDNEIDNENENENEIE